MVFQMKILFIAGWFPDEKSYNGIFVKEHALAVAKKHQVAVIYGERNWRQKERFRFSMEREDGLLVLRFSHKWFPLLSPFNYYVEGVVEAFEKILAGGFKPDILHANIYFTGVPANRIKQKYGIPYVIAEHYSRFPRKSMRRSKVQRARIGMNNAECVMPVCNILREALVYYGIKNKFIIVPNTVNTDVFSYVPAARPEHPTKEVLCVASLRPIKGIANLIKACALTNKFRRDFNLTIIGQGAYEREYKALAEKLKIKNISFSGRQDKSKIVEYMRKSDFFILPSRWENLPCVLIEALSCGLPVLATRVGGIPEIIDESCGKLVEPDNPETLSESMRWMLNNSGDFDRKEISARAEGRYSYDMVCEKLTSVYEEALNFHGKE